jgi:small basic protein (TIGR04137 family)
VIYRFELGGGIKMSIHPSLSSASKTKRHRSVLKRFEKLRVLIEKGKWQEGDSVFALPKVKTLKIKVKKEKAKETEEAAVAAVAGEGEVRATETGQKEKEEEKPKKKS